MKITKRHIPYEKMSKKAQKSENLKQRNDWGRINPVTRIIPSKKVYNRQKFKREGM